MNGIPLPVTREPGTCNFRNWHNDVIKWKHFPRYWPFVRGIHRSRWIPHTKASDAELWCFLRLNKLFGKQWWGWWFETLTRPLWRHRNAFYLPRQWMAYHCLLRENQTRTISGTEADYIQGSHRSIKFMMWKKTLRSNARDITKQFFISNNRMLQTCFMVRNVRENAGHVWSARANPLRRQDNLTTNMILTIQNERHLTFQKGWTLIKCKCMSKSGLY